jgi:hypothetical protein
MVMLKWTLSGGNADYQFIYGSNGDVPYAADWNGDGIDTIALYRPSNGDWYIRLTNSAGAANHTISFGGSNGSTKPIVGVTGP